MLDEPPKYVNNGRIVSQGQSLPWLLRQIQAPSLLGRSRDSTIHQSTPRGLVVLTPRWRRKSRKWRTAAAQHPIA